MSSQFVEKPTWSVDGDTTGTSEHLEAVCSLTLDGGLLDTKWSEQLFQNGTAALACATSTGRLALYALCVSAAGDAHAELRHLASSDTKEGMLLSLDWSGASAAGAKVELTTQDNL